MLGQTVNPSTELTLELGSYVYDPATGQFRYEIPRQTATENLTLARAMGTGVKVVADWLVLQL